jgi:hypothetical protein
MSAATDNTSSQDSNLPREVLATIWGRVADRLQQGEVLVRNDQFLLAMEEEYRVLTGRDPQRAISNYLGQLIEVVNGQHPGTYVMMGLQNSVNKAFDNGVRALQWSEAKIQANGARSIKRPAFRKEIRMLRVAMTVEQFFRDTTDMQKARHMAENFLNLRMRRLFPDISSEETNEIRQRGSSMIDAIEQKMLLERRQGVEEKRRETENATQKLGEESNSRDVDELSEEEKVKGVMIGRVEMRVAGGVRRVPRKIMPDPDDGDRFLLAKRDSETGGPVPEIRRNAKRYVERGRGGAWMISN